MLIHGIVVGESELIVHRRAVNDGRDVDSKGLTG